MDQAFAGKGRVRKGDTHIPAVLGEFLYPSPCQSMDLIRKDSPVSVLVNGFFFQLSKLVTSALQLRRPFFSTKPLLQSKVRSGLAAYDR